MRQGTVKRGFVQACDHMTVHCDLHAAFSHACKPERVTLPNAIVKSEHPAVEDLQMDGVLEIHVSKQQLNKEQSIDEEQFG